GDGVALSFQGSLAVCSTKLRRRPARRVVGIDDVNAPAVVIPQDIELAVLHADRARKGLALSEFVGGEQRTWCRQRDAIVLVRKPRGERTILDIGDRNLAEDHYKPKII